jgi:hypothetical protein
LTQEHYEEIPHLDDDPKKKGKKKRDAMSLRKAPNAPKRFKSSYICFFIAKVRGAKCMEVSLDRCSIRYAAKRGIQRIIYHLPFLYAASSNHSSNKSWVTKQL